MSYSSEIKEYLCSLHVKSKCCRKALLYGILFSSDVDRFNIYFSTDLESAAQLVRNLIKNIYSIEAEYEITEKYNTHGKRVNSYKLLVSEDMIETIAGDMFVSAGVKSDLLACDMCRNAFARGVFISDGTINDPDSGYHLELAVSDKAKRESLESFFALEGVLFKNTVRRNVGSLYVNGSETILDLLTYIGASKYAIDIINLKIKKSIINDENRRRNCDMANIYKSTGAASQLIKAINRMESDGRIEGLDASLKATAELRVKYPELSMKDLADIHEPPISKSGLHHRIEKIMQYYSKCYSD